MQTNRNTENKNNTNEIWSANHRRISHSQYWFYLLQNILFAYVQWLRAGEIFYVRHVACGKPENCRYIDTENRPMYKICKIDRVFGVRERVCEHTKFRYFGCHCRSATFCRTPNWRCLASSIHLKALFSLLVFSSLFLTQNKLMCATATVCENTRQRNGVSVLYTRCELVYLQLYNFCITPKVQNTHKNRERESVVCGDNSYLQCFRRYLAVAQRIYNAARTKACSRD